MCSDPSPFLMVGSIPLDAGLQGHEEFGQHQCRYRTDG